MELHTLPQMWKAAGEGDAETIRKIVTEGNIEINHKFEVRIPLQ